MFETMTAGSASRVAALAMFGEIETVDLDLVVDAKPDGGAGDHQDDRGHDKGPDDGDGDRLELHHELRAGGDAVGKAEAAEARQGEKGDKQAADDAADTVDGEDVEGVVDLQPAADHINREVAAEAAGKAEDQPARNANEAGSRGHGRQAGNHAGDDANK